jgi:ribosomal 50S subunit-recycling heat shock protein
MIPQSNARLKQINAPGFSADADLPATTGAAKWQGNIAAYFKETVMTSAAQMTGAGRVDLLRKTYLVVPSDLKPSVTVNIGDVVIFSIRGIDKTRRVREISAPPSIPGIQSTTRLYFEDE